MRTLVASSDGVTLTVERYIVGGGGECVLFIHGSGGGLHSWRPVAEALGNDGIDAWLLARRSHSPSTTTSAGNSFDKEADDVRRILAVMPGAHLVGASYGALVALQVARNHPSDILSLALWEPPLFAVGPQMARVRDRYRSLLDTHDTAAAEELLLRDVASMPEELIAVARTRSTNKPPPNDAAITGWLSDLDALANSNGDADQWVVPDVPTLLLQGSETWEPMPRALNELAQHLANITRVSITGQTHFAPSTVPERVAIELRRFWSSLEGSTSR